MFYRVDSKPPIKILLFSENQKMYKKKKMIFCIYYFTVKLCSGNSVVCN